MTWKEMLDSEDCELCPYMIEGHQGNFFDDDYGTVWQAYRTKLERSEK